MISRSIVLAIVCMAYPVMVSAGHVDLAWNTNSEADLGGYIVYYGTASKDYDSSIHAGASTYARITGLEENVDYFFALTAYDTSGNESPFSEEVFGQAQPGDDTTAQAGVSGSSGGGCFFSVISQSR